MAQSDSTTGTATSSSATFSALIDRALVLLNDENNATWDTEMVATFLNEAIRDYSQHFPRLRTATLSLTANVQEISLPADFTAVLSVEYPAGQSPPQYLGRLPYTHPDFRQGTRWYDVLPAHDAGRAGELWLSATPQVGETAVIRYFATHEWMADPASPSGSNSVPEMHQHLLLKCVLHQAALHLLYAEQQQPTSSSSLLMAQLSQNARRAESSYGTALRQAIYAAEGASTAVSWAKADPAQRRIY